MPSTSGHGDTVTDSHLELPRVEAQARCSRRELEPFRAAVAAGVACVMTSHVVVTAIDPERPSTFSPTILGDVLRGRLGFDGVIVSDALDMAGPRRDGDPGGRGACSRRRMRSALHRVGDDRGGLSRRRRNGHRGGRVGTLERRVSPMRLARGAPPVDLRAGCLFVDVVGDADLGGWADDVVQQSYSASQAARAWLALDAAGGRSSCRWHRTPTLRSVMSRGATGRRPDDGRGAMCLLAPRSPSLGGPSAWTTPCGRLRNGFVGKDIR